MCHFAARYPFWWQASNDALLMVVSIHSEIKKKSQIKSKTWNVWLHVELPANFCSALRTSVTWCLMVAHGIFTILSGTLAELHCSAVESARAHWLKTNVPTCSFTWASISTTSPQVYTRCGICSLETFSGGGRCLNPFLEPTRLRS